MTLQLKNKQKKQLLRGCALINFSGVQPDTLKSRRCLPASYHNQCKTELPFLKFLNHFNLRPEPCRSLTAPFLGNKDRIHPHTPWNDHTKWTAEFVLLKIPRCQQNIPAALLNYSEMPPLSPPSLTTLPRNPSSDSDKSETCYQGDSISCWFTMAHSCTVWKPFKTNWKDKS